MTILGHKFPSFIRLSVPVLSNDCGWMVFNLYEDIYLPTLSTHPLRQILVEQMYLANGSMARQIHLVFAMALVQ